MLIRIVLFGYVKIHDLNRIRTYICMIYVAFEYHQKISLSLFRCHRLSTAVSRWVLTLIFIHLYCALDVYVVSFRRPFDTIYIVFRSIFQQQQQHTYKWTHFDCRKHSRTCNAFFATTITTTNETKLSLCHKHVLYPINIYKYIAHICCQFPHVQTVRMASTVVNVVLSMHASVYVWIVLYMCYYVRFASRNEWWKKETN